MHSQLNLGVLLLLTGEREAQLRRTHLPVDPASTRRVRRWIGGRLVSLGERLAAEPIPTPVRAR